MKNRKTPRQNSKKKMISLRLDVRTLAGAGLLSRALGISRARLLTYILEETISKNLSLD